ncbi:hypothetical protein EFL58_05480 [Streptococcus thermophilus]|uniref:Uncharacterized protein n=2 Tax=Streptococcus thermophilus TaxID=1308 RepID=Q5M2V7_STRT2|nr:unknown protein [Streptococcus thermophilus LMG 18311]AAV63212.1 unknown protein [Streptococcus thermophilus CNRZ1066]AQW33515.1 hypothetical protein B1761_03960 [Streptococcus thermophilus]ATH75202.1 hypothetical protein CG712_04465 [Streptococcus thermophilus]AUF36371.1 hypothetical protein CW339_08125 [Streptococcus thermophilus]
MRFDYSIIGLIFLSFVSVFVITVNAIFSVTRGVPFLNAHLISTLSNCAFYLLIYSTLRWHHLKKLYNLYSGFSHYRNYRAEVK